MFLINRCKSIDVSAFLPWQAYVESCKNRKTVAEFFVVVLQ
jgi:hypothetical protein